MKISENIENIHINLDYIKENRYNYNVLNDIERDCIIFVEKKEKLLRKYVKNKELGEIIMLYKLFLKMDERRVQKEMKEFMKEHYKEAGLLEGREQGIKEGRKEGRSEGRLEGENNTKISIAKSLKELGVPIDKIVKSTGLTKDKISML